MIMMMSCNSERIRTVVEYHLPTNTDCRLHSHSRAELGLFDDLVTSELSSLPINLPALHLTALAPLAHCAWSCSRLTDEKRRSVMGVMEHRGLPRDSVAGQLLDSWLTSRPDSQLIQVWHDYVGALRWVMSEEAYRSLRDVTITRCQEVISAVSGCFGANAGSGNADPSRVRIEAAFSTPSDGQKD